MALSQTFRMALGQTLSHTFLKAFRLSLTFGRLHHTVPITVVLQALFVGITVLRVELGQLGCLEQVLEHFLLQGTRTVHQRGKVANRIQPLVKQGLQLAFRLREFGHLQVNEGQLVIKHLFRGGVHQLHFVIIRRVLRMETEIQDAYRVNALQTIIPVSTGSLFTNGKGRIIKAPVFEKLLLALLHLHQEIFALFVRAIDIKHGTAVVFLRAQVFRVQVGDVADFLTALQQGIQETDKQILVDFRTEQFLEREIRIKIDVSFVNTFRTHGLMGLMVTTTKISKSVDKQNLPTGNNQP